MNTVTKCLREHYTQTFDEFGPTPKGVDWGAAADVHLRYDKMLAVIDQETRGSWDGLSLLDVGCGYGGLCEYGKRKGIKPAYTGIDVVEKMIIVARDLNDSRNPMAPQRSQVAR